MSAEPTPSGSVELRDYLAVFKRQLVLILAITLLGAAAAAAYTFRRTPVYESNASVLVRAITTNAFDPGSRVDQQLNMFNQRQLAQSEPVAAVAAKSLKTTATPAQLLEHVKVDVPANSQILRIKYRDTVPLTAQRGADAFAEAYLAFREADARAQAKASQTAIQKDVARLQKQASEAEKAISDPDADSNARQAAHGPAGLDQQPPPAAAGPAQRLPGPRLHPGHGDRRRRPARHPGQPQQPPRRRHRPARRAVPGGRARASSATAPTTACGVARTWPSGLTGRSWPPSRPCPSGSARRAGCAGSGGTGTAWSPWSSPTARPPSPTGPCGPGMARLASQLDINSVMVVSAGVGEGKSTTAANLAVVLSETGKDVLLVSADLRRPRVHQFFGLPNKTGLSNLLTDGTPPDKRKGPVADGKQMASELWSVAPNLWVILSGPLPAHPSALMDSDAMRQFLKEQRDLFDFIILDCPPALVVADALALAPLVDAVLVVADAKESDRDLVSRLKEEIEQVGGKIIGAVLNRSKQAGKSTYYYEAQDEWPAPLPIDT